MLRSVREMVENLRRLEEEADQEPECECQQTDVDRFDARGCPLHDPRSAWNERRALLATIREATLQQLARHGMRAVVRRRRARCLSA